MKESIINNFLGNYECDLCGKILQNRRATMVHMSRFHRKPKWMSCDMCPQKFVIKTQMREHVVIHLKYIRFSCEFCEFVGSSRRASRQHRQIHLKVECQICGKRVMRIKSHIKKFHVEDPRKKCEFCQKNILFTCMKNHIAAVHSGKHKCGQCLEKFDVREELRR